MNIGRMIRIDRIGRNQLARNDDTGDFVHTFETARTTKVASEIWRVGWVCGSVTIRLAADWSGCVNMNIRPVQRVIQFCKSNRFATKVEWIVLSFTIHALLSSANIIRERRRNRGEWRKSETRERWWTTNVNEDNVYLIVDSAKMQKEVRFSLACLRIGGGKSATMALMTPAKSRPTFHYYHLQRVGFVQFRTDQKCN